LASGEPKVVIPLLVQTYMENFKWNEECEAALTHLNQATSQPPVISHPKHGETLYLYLFISSEVVSAALTRETK